VYVRSGAAIVHGLYYESTEVETITLPNNSTRIVVVERDWATATARLTHVAALTQTAGTTYDIPLARVVTLGGNVTSITDLREFCEYSGQIQQSSLVTAYIANGAITPAKLENQTRYISRGAGALEPSYSWPAERVNYCPVAPDWYGESSKQYEDAWQFTHDSFRAVWGAFRVPADFTGTTMEVFIHWGNYDNTGLLTAAYQTWGFTCYASQPDVAFAVQSAHVSLEEESGLYDYLVSHRNSLGTITVAKGDIVQFRIYRDGGAATDTSQMPGVLHLVEFEYTADG
jgi:hypothetical protein